MYAKVAQYVAQAVFIKYEIGHSKDLKSGPMLSHCLALQRVAQMAKKSPNLVTQLYESVGA